MSRKLKRLLQKPRPEPRVQTILNTINGENQIARCYPKTGTASQLVTSFIAIDEVSHHLQQCAGNPCLLFTLDAAPLDAPDAASAVTQCQSWPVSDGGQPVISVRCYSAGGQLIQCCGHGLLAAAHSWQRRLQRDAVCLSMNASLVPSWREGDVTWLRFAPIDIHDERVPDWLQQVFRGVPQPRAAALAGEARGYLVLQWPDSFDLARLSRPTAALAECTERALICTAARPEWGSGAIQLRYFAPQYGVAEDAATGSAIRVLAQYWASRFSQLTAYQSSPEGGLLLSRHTATHVDVGGRCVDATEGVYD